MKRFIKITSLLAISISMLACSSKTQKLDTKTFSYAAAVSFGEHLAYMQSMGDFEIDADAVAEAIKAALSGNLKMDPVDAQATVDEFLSITYPAYMVHTAKQFVDNAAKQKGAVKTEAGLVYKIIKEGDNNKPNNTNAVTTTYICKKRSGETFLEITEPETVLLDRHVAGVSEGLQYIGKGGKIQLWIPPQLAFGANGNEELGIFGNEAVYMEIELLDVQ